MDLIERQAAIESIKDPVTKGYVMNALKNVPSVPAVPLDKLCEWLERYATMDCDGCRETFGSCEDTEPSVCNSRERWKAMLTKWMGGLDGIESMVQKT